MLFFNFNYFFQLNSYIKEKHKVLFFFFKYFNRIFIWSKNNFFLKKYSPLEHKLEILFSQVATTLLFFIFANDQLSPFPKNTSQ